MKIKLLIISLLLIILAGCKSTELNKNEAAEIARNFIFENVKNVSPENTMIIKYTYPRILKKDLFLSWGQEYNQYYLAWDLREPKVTVMVFGTGYKDMRDWKPIRVVFKEYNEEDYGEKITEEAGVWQEKPTIIKNGLVDSTLRGTQ